ncbi:uncharacterized protein A1O9_10524 [Exophiala aquamarina CBS 119918]|uniref:DUF7066 domain-containing protein n=1 Tax=Exophiala aquamarina CBS 119918 TaxID=1182545 RepID=A0A072P097_9EURO|nr:uncharacterized protein A1O9_10524 [Exophiala aquamarina CBS 119918]KEF53549.1 hypothetical protein A1O9_10524 [Exophiala aquamarina CBS 119918]
MAINWKLRESVFRLLAAVYAELGEAAVSAPEGHDACPLAELIDAQFKGRYSSIAKFYGNDATYDAVKSFFAKEISRAAEDLHRQNPGTQPTNRPLAQKSSASRSSWRTMHLDFNEQDISFVSEREVEVHSRHALQRPPKRPRISEYPQPHVEELGEQEGQPAEFHSAPEFSPLPMTNGVHNGFQAVNERYTSPQAQTNENHNSNVRNQSVQRERRMPTAPRELTSNSTDPSYVPSPSPIFATPKRTGAAPKKRPYKEIPGCNLGYQTVSSSSQPASDLTQEPESFGYVSNAGLFRCALCFSQLPTQDALDRHEARSQLHLRNLQNPAIVSKGRAKLGQVAALPHQSSDGPTASRPLKLGGFGDRGGRHINIGPSLIRGFTDQDHPPHRRENMANSSRAMDTIEALPRTSRSPPLQIDTAAEGNDTAQPSEFEPEVENMVDKGKRRASPYPTSAAQSYQTAPLNATSQAAHPLNEDESIRPNLANADQNDTTNTATNAKPRATKPPSRLRPLEVAEILRLTGIRLAEKYIAEHPDLIAQTMGRVQREFTAASASVNASVGSVSVEPTIKGARDGKVDINRCEQVNDYAGRRGERARPRNTAMDVDVVILD